MKTAASWPLILPCAMKTYFIKAILSVSLMLFPFLVFAQLPYSPCSPSGGKRADVLAVETKYKAPGGAAPTFTIPAGTRSIAVFTSSETGLTNGLDDNNQGDEDFITINAVIDLTSSTSSGFVNYAKNTNLDGSGTNVYGWKKAPLGAFIPAGSKVGDATPNLNDVNFSVSGSTLTITESATGTNSSYYVEYLSPYNNSLNPLNPEIRALLHGATAANTDLSIPIPAGANIAFISAKGTNSSATDLTTTSGTEEGYSNMRFTIDLDKGLTDGFITLANGGSVNRRSTYVINDMSSTATTSLLSFAGIAGDYAAKMVTAGAVGVYNPQIYISGSNLIIKRDANYARDFDDAYVVEFYTRVGLGMSAEFIDSDIKSIASGEDSGPGASRVFNIPSGTNFIYFNETGNSINTDKESNENSLASYAYIDLNAGTATGYFYQQVGLNNATRRDDNYAFKGVPLNNTSTRSHVNTVGFKGPNVYDISFSLSADKSQLTVTNKTGLATTFYQFLLSADFYGSKPDIAFNTTNITFTKGASCNIVVAHINVCNPGSGNNSGGMPISFYAGDPTSDPTAKLLYTSAFNQAINQGECKTFDFNVDMSTLSNLNITMTMILNDNGSFVTGGVGTAVGTPFTLASLESQNTGYKECYYDNNIITKTINVNNCPVTNLDPDKSSGATGTNNFKNYFAAGSATGSIVTDTDMKIADPDGGDVFGATITLTNILNAGAEALTLTGTLPTGITMTGNGTGVITLSGEASPAAYETALKMITYKNTNASPNTADRIITISVNDGTETGPASTTTMVILTTPFISVVGNGITVADGVTTTNLPDGTNYGTNLTAGAVVNHTFTIKNVGTGVINILGAPRVKIAGDASFTIGIQPSSTAVPTGTNVTFVVSFNPGAHTVGTYTATVTITNDDPNAGRASYTFVVAADVNNLPVITNNTVSANEDNVLAFTAANFTTHYSDADGTALNKIKIVSVPQNGSFKLSGVVITAGQEIPAAQLGNITFTPTANWNGSTAFDWSGSDGTSYATTIATMNININAVNDGPVITVPTSLAITEDVPVSLNDVSLADIDAATGNVTVTISVPNGTVNAVSSGGVTVSGTGSALILNGTLADINAYIAANNLTYASSQNPPASVIITVNISDNGNTGSGGALQDTKTITIGITAVNDAPASAGDTRSTPEETPVNGAVTGTDAEGDVLTYTKATDPGHGTVTGVNAATGAYTYTPNADYNGPDSFTMTISDGNGGSVTVTVNITVTPVNDAPTGTGDTRTTAEDIPVTGSVSGSDIDGDVLTYTKATDPVHGTVTVNAATGAYTYTPDPNYNGPDSFTITISDGNGGSVTVTVNITVTPVNDSPAGTGNTRTTPEETPVSGAVIGNDVDGDLLTYAKATDPTHGTVTGINAATGAYTYTPNADYNGPDSFTMTISDGNGGSTTVTVNITVTPVNDAPTGTGDTRTTAEDISVTGSVSGSDIDGDVLTYTKATDPLHGTVTVNAATGAYTYTPDPNYNGPDSFTITISDGNGGSTTVTVNITVTPVNDSPAGTGNTRTTPEETPVSGAVIGNDVDGDLLTYAKATNPAHGTVTGVNAATGAYTYTPNADYNGPDSFTMTISDGNGGSVTVTVNITVTPVNDSPTGTGDTRSTPEDTPVNGSVSGSDIDGDVLTYTKATDPSHGTVTVNSTTGGYTYTPDTDYNGPDSFTITITDGNGGSTTVTVNITVSAVNNAPTGTGDTQTTNEDEPVSGVVGGTDTDGDALTYTKATDPSHGSVTVNSTTGDYTYTPDADYNGPDSFTITVSDGNGGSDVVTVNITVNPVNDSPTGTGDTRTTNEDTPVSGAVSGSNVDGYTITYDKLSDPQHGTVSVDPVTGAYTYTPDADYNGPDNFLIQIGTPGGILAVPVNITVNPVNDDPTGTGDTRTTNEDTPVSGSVTGVDIDGDALTYTKATNPSHGSVTVNVTTGAYTYTPNADYNGPDSFTITIDDGNGGTTTVTVNITVTAVNDNPTGTGDTKTTNEDIPVSGSVIGADIDGDVLTYTKATDPSHGTVTVNSTTGAYTYTPSLNYNGPDSFTITIDDGNGGTTTVTVNVTVTAVNNNPTGTGDTKTTNEDTPVSGSVTGADIDGDALTYTKATDPSHGSVTVNATTGAYTYTPSLNYNGPDSFTITIDDGNGGTTTVTVNITVTAVNDNPTGTGDTKTTNEDTPVNGSVSGSDIDGDVLTYTKATDPSHGSVTVNATTGAYTYTPDANYNGPDSFTITIDDGNGGTTTVTVNITVNAVNDNPTGTGDTKTTNEDTPVSGGVSGTDIDGDALTYTKATDPSHGSVTVNATTGAYTYTPDANYNGPDSFTITIDDGNGGTTTVTVNVTVNAVNDNPTGTGDTKTTNEDTPVSGSVTGTDIDGDALTYTKATDPSHGSVTVNATTGAYTYTPDANYNGPDSFTITIDDGNGGTITVTVNITVTAVNDNPTGTGDTKTTNEDTPVSGGVSGTDIDGDALTYTKATDPSHGSVTVNATTGAYTYTPDANYNGPDSFTITIDDGNGGTTTVTVNITVNAVNDNPTGTGDTKTTNEDTPVNGSVSGSDIDGDVLTYTKATDPSHGTVTVNSTTGAYTYTPAADYDGPDSFTITIGDGNGGTTIVTVNITVTAVNDNPTGTGDTKTTNEDTPVTGGVSGTDIDGDALTYTKATDPSHGTVTVNATTGAYTYTPATDYNGPDSFTITIDDGNGGTTTVTVNITVNAVNDAPTGTGDTKTTNEDTPVSGSVTGTDKDGDALNYTKATDPSHGTVTVNPTTGDYTYTPAADYDGPDNFTITIGDGNGGTTTVTVNVTVAAVNDNPTGTGDTKTTAEQTPVTGTVSGADVDGDVLTYTKATDPTHGTATVTGTSYTYTPTPGYTGPDSFTITIDDGNGGTTTVTVSLTVNPGTPGVSLVKTAVVNGDKVTYTFTFKNTGDVTLSTVTLTDTKLGIINKDIPVTGGLAPGASTTYTEVYTLTDAEKATGTVSNSASVKAQTPGAVEVGDISGTDENNDDSTITTLPAPPVAADDQANTHANVEVIIPVQDNDDAGTVEIVTAPDHGTVVVNTDGTVTYTPTAGYTGEDAFTYHVKNADGYYSNTATVTMTINSANLTIPTLFTPNGDGKNDVFEIRDLNQYADNEMIIVNRWGNEVFRQKNYQNKWDGNGLNEGTYYYLLRVKRTSNSQWEVIKGFITLVRAFKK
jgi:gliding motility-associated-like protein